MRRVLLLPFLAAFAIAHQSLQQQLHSMAADAHGTVTVACALPGSSLDCDLHPTAHPPMQSVFKLPLGITILHQGEQGKFVLDQPIHFAPEDRILPKPYSPLQDKYPDANVDIPLRTLLQMTVTLSDNTAADILLRLAGGPKSVSDYIASLGVTGFHLLDGEHALHRDVAIQYRNWFEPRGAVLLLRRIADHSPLTPEHTELLFTWMRASIRTNRIQGDLPAGTVAAHKAGTSDVTHGLAHATNDIGLVALPGSRQLAIAIFVTDSTADEATRDKVIARISRAIYDAALKTHTQVLQKDENN
jgi:beta-lactamase class A